MRAPPIPSSLKWLINRKSRLAGEILRLQKEEAERNNAAQVVIDQLRAHLAKAIEDSDALARKTALTCQQYEQEIAATDMLIRSHEAGIDPNIIRPMRSNQNLSPYDYGFMTRCIYQCLGISPGTPRTAADATSLMVQQLGIALTADQLSDLRYRVRHRMKSLTREGKLTRVPNQVGCIEGRWLLGPELRLRPPPGTLPGGDDLASTPATSETDHCQRSV